MAKKNRINLSYVGENIKKIRQAKKMSQADFAKIFDLARASVGAYEEGRSEPKIEMLITMANYFGISIDALLTRKLTINEIFKVNTLNEKLNRAHQLKGSPKPSASVRFVHADSYTDYIVHHSDRSYVDSLGKTGFPDFNQHPDMAFEMNGTEMSVGNHGIRHGDILFGKEIDAKALKQSVNRVLVIITETELIIRRLTTLKGQELTLSADDSQYPVKNCDLKTVEKVFEVVAVASQYFPVPDKTEDRLARIEEELRKLKK